MSPVVGKKRPACAKKENNENKSSYTIDWLFKHIIEASLTRNPRRKARWSKISIVM
jgi:hypothetical protein